MDAISAPAPARRSAAVTATEGFALTDQRTSKRPSAAWTAASRDRRIAAEKT